MDLGLRGKKAMVTGGTRGIGRAIAEQLAKEGADVADAVALKGWIKNAAGALGGLDILVPNVSAMAGNTEADWRRAFEIDIMGTINTIDTALPYLEQSDAGAVVVRGELPLDTRVGELRTVRLEHLLVVREVARGQDHATSCPQGTTWRARGVSRLGCR